MYLLIFLLTISTTLAQDLPPQNPVIGIYTQTLTNSSSYISASYIKFVQMSGAQVVPIFSFSDTSEILNLLGKINGVLFPGNFIAM